MVANEPLRVSLADLHSAETRGKWWLVGAAWGGDPLVDRQQDKDDTSKQQPISSSNALLKLAKKQGMNTDIRRSVFVVLMSSDVGFMLLVRRAGISPSYLLGLRGCL